MMGSTLSLQMLCCSREGQTHNIDIDLNTILFRLFSPSRLDIIATLILKVGQRVKLLKKYLKAGF